MGIEDPHKGTREFPGQVDAHWEIPGLKNIMD
jgi:hypothetical protein